MVKLKDIFDLWYGVNLEVVNSTVVDNGIPFVSRQSVNNGVVCYVAPIEGIKPNPANTLSIAVSGSVLSTFYHDYEYYSGRDVYVAKPKEPMTKEEMLYYAYIIEQNKYRYNYGRGANRTFKDIIVPARHEVPKAIKLTQIPIIKKESINQQCLSLNTEEWKWFRYDEIFDIKHGFYNKKPEDNPDGDIPFIGATDSNNGVTSHSDLETIANTTKTGDGSNSPMEEKLFSANCITVSNDGSVGFAFFQSKEFTCSHSVNPLYLKGHEINPYIALFLCTIIEKERFRWAYGRKWRPKRMPSSMIKLPVTHSGKPDWKFMEDYIKSLPYSKNLEPIDPNEQIRALKKKLALTEHQLQAVQTEHAVNIHIYESGAVHDDNSTNISLNPRD